MKKRSIVVFILISLISLSVSFGVEHSIGDKINDVLFTDIITEINGQQIESFNINGSTAIYVNSAKKLGYDVIWNGEKRLVTIKNNVSQNPLYSESKMSSGSLSYQIGDKINDVLYTDIKTVISGEEVESFNINGSTAIYVSALRKTGASVIWNAETREVIISNVEMPEELANAKVATFNTLHLGWDNNKDFVKLAIIINNFDLVALEEVMSEDGLIELTSNLNNISDKNWNYHISDKKVGRSSYKEYYGFVYNDNVEFLESEGFYPDTNDVYERDPYAASFKIYNFDFTFVVLHSIYGDSKTERQMEASYLDDVYAYYQNKNKNENDIFIGGDFNLSAIDQAFDLINVDEIDFALKPVRETTIGLYNLASAYDNIWYSKYTTEILETEVYDFTNNDYETIRKSVSDHLPVYMLLNTMVDNDIVETGAIGFSNESEESIKLEDDKIDVKIISVDKSKEIVVIKNNTDLEIDMSDWVLKSVLGSQFYDFPDDYILVAGGEVTIVSGSNNTNNGDSILKWTGSYIWNNTLEDRAELYNNDGELVDSLE